MKSARENDWSYIGGQQLIANFSLEIMKSRKTVEWHIKRAGEKVPCSWPRILYPIKPFFEKEIEIKILPDKQKQRRCY